MTCRVGCVSFLNAVPLIDGVDDRPDVTVHYDVPSALLAWLEEAKVDVALCPVIDLQRSRVPLKAIPVGGIGCDGPTLTVRIFSRVPIHEADEIAADTDSHTSVVLMRVLLNELYDRRPNIVPLHASMKTSSGDDDRDTMLLIGDKVITRAPDEAAYPYQLDLGEAWKQLTGLPFVFAVWMARQETDLGELPALLNAARLRNMERLPQLVQQHAPRHDWPLDVASQYLGHWLRYGIGEREREAMHLFFDKASQQGLISDPIAPVIGHAT